MLIADFQKKHLDLVEILASYDTGVDGGASPGSYTLDLSSIGFTADADWQPGTVIVITITDGGANSNTITINAADSFSVSGTGTFTLSGAESITRASGALTLVTSAQTDYSGNNFKVTAFVKEVATGSLGITGLLGNGTQNVGQNERARWNQTNGIVTLPAETPSSDQLILAALDLSALSLTDIDFIGFSPLVPAATWENDMTNVAVRYDIVTDVAALSFTDLQKNGATLYELATDVTGRFPPYLAGTLAGTDLAHTIAAGEHLVISLLFSGRGGGHADVALGGWGLVLLES